MRNKTLMIEPYTLHLLTAIDAAQNAGELIRKSTNFKASLSGLEFKAAIDDLADKTIISRVRRNFPTDDILTEETGFPSEENKKLWVVNPLDGTTNFLNGLRMFTTLITYVEDGEPIISVSHLPRNNETLVAIKGHGAFINKNKVEKTADTRPLRRANIALDPGYDPEGAKKVVWVK